MAIVLGGYTFDDARTSVVEKHEEIGGRDARVIQIKGVIDECTSLALLEAELDQILAAASEEEDNAILTLRTGRRLLVRRTGFSREILRGALTGSFVIDLEAKNPYEEAESLTEVTWSISSSGATKALSTNGNVFALPTVTLVASGAVVEPSFSDGTRSIAYTGEIGDGETLVFDAAQGVATLEDEDVAPYTTGLFPQIAPGGSTFTYTDDDDSSHTASVTITYRDRWW